MYRRLTIQICPALLLATAALSVAVCTPTAPAAPEPAGRPPGTGSNAGPGVAPTTPPAPTPSPAPGYPPAPSAPDFTPPAPGTPPAPAPTPGTPSAPGTPPAPTSGAPPAPISGAPPAPMPPPGPPVPAPIPPNAREGLPDKALVVYWGQNGSGGRTPGDRTRYEKELDEVCEQNPHYDALILGFVIMFEDTINASRGPRLNFSFHCETAYDDKNPTLLRCPQIEKGIVACQQKRKKVLLSLGGAAGSYFFTSDAQAEKFAQTTWDMFMGGKSDVRPFGTAIIDGIDLDLEGGPPTGYPAYVRKLRALTRTDPSRRYLITGAPQCPFPDAFMGPRPGLVLGEAADQFDYLWPQFYNNHCFFGGGTFNEMLGSWTKVAGPKIFIGLPAAPDAGGGYVNPGQLPGVIGLVGRGGNGPQGIMLWDASYDRLNVVGNQTYGARVGSLLGK
jgi:chitinase